MNVYPAIDILGGRVVRLRQGRREDVTEYGAPVDAARRWVSEGARWLHVVDLDGAFAGEPRNADEIREIRSQCTGVRIQVGGGIRSMAAVERLLGDGIDRVVLGTAAVDNPGLIQEAVEGFSDRIAVGIDARDGKVRLDGWTRSAALTSAELAVSLEALGVQMLICTDISRDGELEGVNIEAMSKILDATGLRIIASGGVSTLADIRRLQELGHPRLDGAIIGKALYEDRIELGEVVRVLETGRAR